MKKLHFLKISLSAILFIGIFSFTAITKTYAQEMTEYTWSDYKTKFSVPTSFTVSKSSGEQWEGSNDDITLSLFPRKGENLTQREMDKQLRTWARDESVIELGEITDVDSKKLNGYWGVFIEGKKEGLEDTVLKILYSFIPI